MMNKLATSLVIQEVQARVAMSRTHYISNTHVSSLNWLKSGNNIFIAPVQVDFTNPNNCSFIKKLDLYLGSTTIKTTSTEDCYVTNHMAAFLLCLGYTVEELTTTLNTIDFNNFLTTSNIKYQPFLATIDNKAKCQYACTVEDPFFNWAKQQVSNKFCDAFVTFADLNVQTRNNNTLRNVNLIVLNVTTNKLEVFNYKNTPDLPLAIAMRICATGLTAFSMVEINDLILNTRNTYLDSSVLLKHLSLVQDINLVNKTFKNGEWYENSCKRIRKENRKNITNLDK